MKHTHITILKEDLERFKTACEVNIGTNFLHTSDASLHVSHITCHIDFKMTQDIFHLGAKFERNENG